LAEFEGGFSCLFAGGGGIGSFFVVDFLFIGLVVFLGGDSLEGFYVVVAGCRGRFRS